MVESAYAADASCGLIAGAHAVNGIELLSRGGAGCSLICVGDRLGDRVLKRLAARGRYRYRSRSQTGQRRAALQELPPVRLLGVHGTLLNDSRMRFTIRDSNSFVLNEHSAGLPLK